jgi:DNA/RNA-binding domain of Phe-tRNA-synthetase-like protein
MSENLPRKCLNCDQDYRALLIVVEGLSIGPDHRLGNALLREAEDVAKKALSEKPVTELPHIAAWRDAYKASGAKPKKKRNSLESLMRCTEKGLPRVNCLTDIYNAVLVKHQIPLGGEDLDKYIGSPSLVQASGQEQFETIASGEKVVGK